MKDKKALRACFKAGDFFLIKHQALDIEWYSYGINQHGVSIAIFAFASHWHKSGSLSPHSGHFSICQTWWSWMPCPCYSGECFSSFRLFRNLNNSGFKSASAVAIYWTFVRVISKSFNFPPWLVVWFFWSLNEQTASLERVGHCHFSQQFTVAGVP